MWWMILYTYLAVGLIFSIMFYYHDYQPETNPSYKIFQFISVFLFWLPIMLVGSVKRH